MYRNELQDLSDKDLMRLKWMAEETGSKTISAIKAELNRRIKEL